MPSGWPWLLGFCYSSVVVSSQWVVLVSPREVRGQNGVAEVMMPAGPMQWMQNKWGWKPSKLITSGGLRRQGVIVREVEDYLHSQNLYPWQLTLRAILPIQTRMKPLVGLVRLDTPLLLRVLVPLMSTTSHRNPLLLWILLILPVPNDRPVLSRAWLPPILLALKGSRVDTHQTHPYTRVHHHHHHGLRHRCLCRIIVCL